MRQRPMFRAPVIALLALAAIAGCGDDDDDTASDATTTSEGSGGGVDTSELGLVEEGTLTLCSDTPYEPFEFEDEETGEQTGFDIELMRAVADDAGLDVEVIDLPFDGILGRIAAGECDVVASAVSIDAERDMQVDFSEPYFESGQSLLVRAEDADTYTSLADVAGERIGVQAGTTGRAYAEANAPEGTEIVDFEDADGLFGAIASGDIVGILQDYPVNAYRAAQDDSVVVAVRFEAVERYGFVVEEGDTAMKEFIDAGLDALRADGRFDEIFAMYFSEAE
jgi:polar amino acid transport system substrate-binding protein